MRKAIIGLLIGVVLGVMIPVQGGEPVQDRGRGTITQRIRALERYTGKLQRRIATLQRKTNTLDATGFLNPIAINRRVGCSSGDPVVWGSVGIGC
jgi:hypothetical protein